jgi:hypothetical protein
LVRPEITHVVGPVVVHFLPVVDPLGIAVATYPAIDEPPSCFGAVHETPSAESMGDNATFCGGPGTLVAGDTAPAESARPRDVTIEKAKNIEAIPGL